MDWMIIPLIAQEKGHNRKFLRYLSFEFYSHKEVFVMRLEDVVE